MTNDSLRTILPIAGWSEDRARAVEITGDSDPILPTPFRIGETSAAALAAVGLAVSDLAGGLMVGVAYLLFAIWVVEVVLVRPDDERPVAGATAVSVPSSPAAV